MNGDQINLVVQGGAMRLAYGLGVLASVEREALRPRVRSIYTASAGTIAALAFAAGDVEQLSEEMLAMLTGRRFISPRRIWTMVDVDYLVDQVVAPLIPMEHERLFANISIYVVVTEESTGRARYVQMTKHNAREVLRATMAIPCLYGRSVALDLGGVRRYIDGGIVDPVPLAECWRNNPGEVCGVILTKDIGSINANASGLERLFVRLDPRLSNPVRSLILNGSPIGFQAANWLGRLEDSDGVVTIAPSDADTVVSRTCTDRGQLEAFRKLGATDGHSFAARLATRSRG